MFLMMSFHAIKQDTLCTEGSSNNNTKKKALQ
jgi:hypothetical protein